MYKSDIQEVLKAKKAGGWKLFNYYWASLAKA